MLQQAPADTGAYSSPALRALVARAADSNAVLPRPQLPRAFRVGDRRQQGPARTGSRASRAWSSSTARSPGAATVANQHSQGYRDRHDRPSAAGRLRPRLGLDRARAVWRPLHPAQRSEASRSTTGPHKEDSLEARAENVVHPLASDRDQYYSYARGDTVEVDGCVRAVAARRRRRGDPAQSVRRPRHASSPASCTSRSAPGR